MQWYVALPKRLIFERLFRGKAHKFLTFTNFPGEYNFYIGNKSKRVNVPVFSSASCVAVKFYWLIPFPCCLLQIPTLLVFRDVHAIHKRTKLKLKPFNISSPESEKIEKEDA